MTTDAEINKTSDEKMVRGADGVPMKSGYATKKVTPHERGCGNRSVKGGKLTQMLVDRDRAIKNQKKEIYKKDQEIRALKTSAAQPKPSSAILASTTEQDSKKVGPIPLFGLVAEAILLPTAMVMTGGALFGSIVAAAGVQVFLSVFTYAVVDESAAPPHFLRDLVRGTGFMAVGFGLACLAVAGVCQWTGNSRATRAYGEQLEAALELQAPEVWAKGKGITVCKKVGDPTSCYLVSVAELTPTITENGHTAQTANLEIVGRRKNSITNKFEPTKGNVSMTRYTAGGKSFAVLN